ncbi:hypothetical protein PR048_010584 [Dryococelus australis]|uniref:Uncharacterized protein n=1 Tax=Dryococelus australis TaxID=614101 RepID=A0ABQ9I334_9NEOP|nr:hypothetical protein PR048_010584 [Dryococelus australis]
MQEELKEMWRKIEQKEEEKRNNRKKKRKENREENREGKSGKRRPGCPEGVLRCPGRCLGWCRTVGEGKIKSKEQNRIVQIGRGLGAFGFVGGTIRPLGAMADRPKGEMFRIENRKSVDKRYLPETLKTDSDAVSLLASHQGEPGSIPGRVTPGFSRMGIVLDDAVGRGFFSRGSPVSPPFRSGAAPYLSHLHRLSRPRFIWNYFDFIVANFIGCTTLRMAVKIYADSLHFTSVSAGARGLRMQCANISQLSYGNLVYALTFVTGVRDRTDQHQTGHEYLFILTECINYNRTAYYSVSSNWHSSLDPQHLETNDSEDWVCGVCLSRKVLGSCRNRTGVAFIHPACPNQPAKCCQYQLGSPLVDNRPMLNAVKYRVMSGVVCTNRMVMSSYTDANRTDVLAVMDLGDSLLICLKCWGAAMAERLDCLPSTKANWVQTQVGHPRIFVVPGLCRWSVSFLGYLPSPPPPGPTLLYSHLISPSSGSQYLVVKCCPNFSTQIYWLLVARRHFIIGSYVCNAR